MRKFLIYFPLFLIISAAILYVSPAIDYDGLTLYALAQSLIMDGDFDLNADPLSEVSRHLITAPFPDIAGQRPIFSCGYPLAYFPFLKLMTMFDGFRILTDNMSHFADIADRYHGFSILTGTLTFFILLIFSTWRVVSTRYDSWITSWSILTAVMGTPVFLYAFRFPSDLVILDALMVTLCIAALDKNRFSGTPSAITLFAAGTAGGLSICIRNINIPTIFCLCIMGIGTGAVSEKYRESKIKRLVLICLGLLPFIGFQLHYNLNQYGNAFQNGMMPPDIYSSGHSLADLLILPRYGILIWFPIFGIGILGWIFMFFRDRRLSITSWLIAVSVLAGLMIIPNWWDSSPYSTKYCALMFLPLCAGVAETITRFRWISLPVAIGCALFSFVIHNAVITVNQNGSADVFESPLDLMKTAHRISDPTYATTAKGFRETLMDGKKPAIIPNLLHHFTNSKTVFVISLHGTTAPANPYQIKGELKVYSRSETTAALDISVWGDDSSNLIHLPDDRFEHYQSPIYLKKGRNNIHWIYDLMGGLKLIPGNYADPINIPRRLFLFRNRPSHAVYMECGILSNDNVRSLPLHIPMSVTTGDI